MAEIKYRKISTIPKTSIYKSFANIINHGTTEEHNGFLGFDYEITYDSSKNTLVLHKNKQKHYLLKENQDNIPSSGVNTGLVRSEDGTKLFVTCNGKKQLMIDENGNVGINSESATSVFYINGEDAIKIPAGTISARPVNPEVGMIRYLIDKDQLEFYSGVSGNWLPFAGRNSYSIKIGPFPWNDNSVNNYINPLDEYPTFINPALRSKTSYAGYVEGEEVLLGTGTIGYDGAHVNYSISTTTSTISLILVSGIRILSKISLTPLTASPTHWDLYFYISRT